MLRTLFIIPRPAISLSVSLAIITAISSAACSGGPAGTVHRDEDLKRYDLKGTVVSVDRAKMSVTVDHEEIPGYMPAMRMPLPVREADVLDSLEGGDSLHATLVVADSGYWVENISVMKGGEPPAGAAGGTEPSPGSEVPDVSLVNQDGETLRLRGGGKARVVTFIYTRCPLPDYCPLMSANFAAVNSAVADDPRLRDRVRLLSVTLDPAFDTPPVLREYGLRYAGEAPDAFARWDFATGDPGEIRRLAEYLGLSYREEDGQILHSLRTAVITPDGRLEKLYRGNDWKPSQVVGDLAALPHSGAK